MDEIIVKRIELINKTKYPHIWKLPWEHMYPSYKPKEFMKQLESGPMIVYVMFYEKTDEGFAYHVMVLQVIYDKENSELKVIVENVDDQKLAEINGKWGSHFGCCNSDIIDFLDEIIKVVEGEED